MSDKLTAALDWLISCAHGGSERHRALWDHVQRLQVQVAALRAENARLCGALGAQDERERTAAERVGVTWYGCDTPEAMGDEIQWLRGENARLRAREATLCGALGVEAGSEQTDVGLSYRQVHDALLLNGAPVEYHAETT